MVIGDCQDKKSCQEKKGKRPRRAQELPSFIPLSFSSSSSSTTTSSAFLFFWEVEDEADILSLICLSSDANSDSWTFCSSEKRETRLNSQRRRDFSLPASRFQGRKEKLT